MAAKLECEICGGKLIGKPGGIFECDSCGMEYSTEWAKAKIQEIKGTVKVEGTVEVTGKVQVEGGTVQVEGAATKESLLKRAEMCCAEKDWEKARELIEQVLNIDPECGEAYLIAVMVEEKMESRDILHNYCVNANCVPLTGINMDRVQQFLPELMSSWEGERGENEKVQATRIAKKAATLNPLRKVAASVRNMVHMGQDHIAALRADGTVLTLGNNSKGQCDTNHWTDVIAIDCGDNFTVGLRQDGTVLATGDNTNGQCDVGGWQEIVAVVCGSNWTIGLKKDGTVIATGENSNGQCDVETWQDVSQVSCGYRETFGIQNSGRVFSTKTESGIIDEWEHITALSSNGNVAVRENGTVAIRKEWEAYFKNIDQLNNVISVEISDDCDCIYGLQKDGSIIVAQKGQKNRKLDLPDIVDLVRMEPIDDAAFCGLCRDGSVVAASTIPTYMFFRWENVKEWKKVVWLCFEQDDFVAVCCDGRVLTTNEDFDVAGWRLFNSIDTLEQERAEGPAHAKAERIAKETAARIAREKAEAERRAQERAALLAEQNELQTELSQLKGLFSGKRRREIEARLAELSTALRELEEKA